MSKKALLLNRIKVHQGETKLWFQSQAIHKFFENLSHGETGNVPDCILPGEYFVLSGQSLPNLGGYGSLDCGPTLEDAGTGSYNFSFLRHSKLGEGIELAISRPIPNGEYSTILSSLKGALNCLWGSYMRSWEQSSNFLVDPAIMQPASFVTVENGVVSFDPL